MLSLIAFVIVVVGGANWFSIGILQYDFVAGMFGSQANIFSRLIYAVVGIATIWLIYSAIRYKGKVISFNKNGNKNILPFLNKDKEQDKQEEKSNKQTSIMQKNESLKNKQSSIGQSNEQYERAKAYRRDNEHSSSVQSHNEE